MYGGHIFYKIVYLHTFIRAVGYGDFEWHFFMFFVGQGARVLSTQHWDIVFPTSFRLASA